MKSTVGMKMFPLAAACLVLASASAARATTTFLIDFNNQAALARLPSAGLESATAPWYFVRAPGSVSTPTTFTMQDNSTEPNSFLLKFEDPCMNCIVSSGEPGPGAFQFGYNRQCVPAAGPAVPPCIKVDTTFMPRWVSPRDGNQSLLLSAKTSNQLTGTTSVRNFSLNSFVMRDHTRVIVCVGQAAAPGGVLCTGIVSEPGSYSLAGGPYAWMEIHGVGALFSLDDVVVSF